MTVAVDGGATATPGLLARLDELLGRQVSMRSMSLLRVLVGPVALMHLRPFLDRAREGVIYRDRFYEPFADWYPELPRELYISLLWIGAAATVAMTIGLRTRLATTIVFGVVTYNLLLSTTHLHNNRAYLVTVLAALAVTRTGGELSLDAWLRRRYGLPPEPTTAPAWPLWLLRFEAATVYGASGASKLIDADWWGGTVTWHRLTLVRDRLEASVLPGWAIDVLTDRDFHTVAAKVIVLTELFIAVGLWWRRTRYAAVWVAVCFHVAIQLSARVEVFSYLAISALVIWAVPATRDRVLTIDPLLTSHRRFAGAVRVLDWLARFRIDRVPESGSLHLIDRNGRTRTGGAAARFVASRLPLTAWVALPTLLADRAPRSAPPHGGSR